ncbi:MAG: Na(+)/H(+) antiporter subunit B [Thermodesulfobacteriota bacterium]|nr:Na(+)/H(+) antiporter subunit B [Thermodesulfobacteriota bacterium]
MLSATDNIILKTVARILIPFIQIYALYVIMHGHHSPGGGFQGGVILGASLILLILTHGWEETKKKFSETRAAVFCALGVLIYAGIGGLCLILGGNYLDYGKLSKLLQVIPAEARSLGILGVEIGVGITVMAVMFSIFFDISTGGRLTNDEEKTSHS